MFWDQICVLCLGTRYIQRSVKKYKVLVFWSELKQSKSGVQHVQPTAIWELVKYFSLFLVDLQTAVVFMKTTRAEKPKHISGFCRCSQHQKKSWRPVIMWKKSKNSFFKNSQAKTSSVQIMLVSTAWFFVFWFSQVSFIAKYSIHAQHAAK